MSNKLEHRGVKLWNEIDINLKKLPLYTFNKQYKNALLAPINNSLGLMYN